MELYPIDIAIHLVNILVLYVLLRVLIWKPVRQFMAGREERVAAQMEQARALQAEAEKIKADYDARLVDVQATCDKMLSEGRLAAQTTGQKYIDKARAQADTILSEARAQADEEKRRAMDEVKEELADLAGKLEEAGNHVAYEQVMAAVSDFEKGNMRLSVVLSSLDVK